MFIKNIKNPAQITNIIFLYSLSISLLVAMDGETKGNESIHIIRKIHPYHQKNSTHLKNSTIEITAARLQSDKLLIKKYVMKRVASDIKKAKKWGKGMARAFGGISGYVFDAIPFEFFTDNFSIDEAFRRLEEGVSYIRELKETFKKNILGSKKRISQGQLAEFLYAAIVDKLAITDAQRALLKKEPIKMDEFVRNGIVKRSEYMYYTLLNFVVRYYLEQELKK
jgi:hypothetical protein